MKLGTATSVFYLYELKDAVPLIAKAGFDGVDVWGGRPHVYRQDYSPAELRTLREQITGEGLAVSSFMPAFYRYPHSLSSPNPKVRADSIQYMRECADNAAVLGARVVLVVPDHSLHGQTPGDSLKRMTESIAEVANYARQYDLKLGIEVLFFDETDFVNSSEDALGIILQVGLPNLGVVADSGTMNLSKETPAQMLDKLGGLLLQVHVNDNHGEEKQQNLIPGEGTFDFQDLMTTLQRSRFEGFVSAELSKEYAADPYTALKLTADRLRAWMKG
jgi:protein FrlC